MADKRKNLRKIKPKKRIRGAPIFMPAVTSNVKTDLVKSPETVMEIAKLLFDEVHKRWPEVQMPEKVIGKHVRLNKSLLEEFSGETLKEMIRILVWDFDAIRANKQFFPPSAHLNWPWLDQLYNYRYALAGAVKEGITDSTFRVSIYRQRYHSENNTTKPDVATSDGKLSMKDLARRALGQ